MLLPLLLPAHLENYSAYQTEVELFNALKDSPSDLVTFLECACDDETWSEKNHTFLFMCIEWVTFQFLEEKLSLQSARRIANIIHSHFPILNPLITRNISINSSEKEVPVNSLMLAVSCEFFHDVIRAHRHLHQRTVIHFDNISSDLLNDIVEFAMTGAIAHLWRHTPDELYQLLRQARAFQINKLMELCEETLKRYINQNNVFDLLIMANAESWPNLQQSCCSYINALSLGVQLETLGRSRISSEEQPLALEFFNFHDAALHAFSQLRQIVTHLIFGGSLIEEKSFSYIIKSAPRLISLDIGHSQAFSDRLTDIPPTLIELNLSKCEWLTNFYLKKMIAFCPFLKKLILNSNVQLTYIGWTELQKLPNLHALDISRCYQIQDEDFILILKACANAHVIELQMEECRKLSDKAFAELAKNLPLLVSLNVSRCHISNGTLLELASRCHQLQFLNITRCREITNTGIVQFIKHAHSLRELNIRQCEFSSDTIEEIKLENPHIALQA